MTTRERAVDPASLTMGQIEERLLSGDTRLARVVADELTRTFELLRRVRATGDPEMASSLDATARVLVDELTDQLTRAVRDRLTRADAQSLRRLGEPHEVAESWAAQLPLAPSPLDELTGPFYDTPSLRKWLGVTRQALDSRARHGSILALTTGDGSRVYPAWQWRADKNTVPHLAEVLAPLLSGARDPWSVALWMTAPVDWGGGDEVAAWKWLDENHDPEPVLAEARADGARWAS